MRSLLLSIATLPLAFSYMSGQQPAAELGAISGHVYCADSQTPCRFATITIQSVPHIKNNSVSSEVPQTYSFSASTDIDGSYEIRGVTPGEYYILGRLSGYLSPYDLASNAFSGDSPLLGKAIDIALLKIKVNPNLTTTSNLTLSRGASLAGTILYDDGGFAINILIHLYRKDGAGSWKPYKNSAGTSTFAQLGLGPRTDDRGRFYEPGLPPGSYLVEATLPAAITVPTTIIGKQSLSLNVTSGDALRVFNGQKFRMSDAVAIELHDGEQRSEVVITLPTKGLRSLHGIVSAKLDGHSITHGTLRLLDPDDKSPLRQTSIEADGSFIFNYVVDGSYLLEIDPTPEDGDARTTASYRSLTTPLLVEADIFDLSYALASTNQ